PGLETPHYRIRRVRDDQIELPENIGTSYKLAEVDVDLEAPQVVQDKKPVEQAAIVTVTAPGPAPVVQPEAKKGPGLFARFLALFQGSPDKDAGKSDRDKRRHVQDHRRRGGRQPDRHDDARRRGPDRDRSSRKKKQDRQPAAKAPADEGARQQRQQERKKPAEARREPQAEESAVKREEGRHEGRKKSGKRRSRGGRRRRKNAENSDLAARGEQQQGASMQNPQADMPSRPPAQQQARSNGQDRETFRETLSESAVDDRVEDAAPVSAAVNVVVPTIATVSATSAIDYEDTQPELPLIREPYERPPVVEAARFVATPKPAAYQPAASSESVPVAQRAPDVEKTTDAPQPAFSNVAAEPRPQGRLLPWEPQAAPVEPQAAPVEKASPEKVTQEASDDRDAPG
ncbi:MAG: hypothetical protein L0Y45_00130, partial [Woeseiaceae bacterium]|nr:hypothetical protein [Woeseiaceae bacterium]